MYLGCIGLLVSVVMASYYTYVVSWGVGYSVFSAFGTYFGKDAATFLYGYTGGDRTMFLISYVFFILENIDRKAYSVHYCS